MPPISKPASQIQSCVRLRSGMPVSPPLDCSPPVGCHRRQTRIRHEPSPMNYMARITRNAGPSLPSLAPHLWRPSFKGDEDDSGRARQFQTGAHKRGGAGRSSVLIYVAAVRCQDEVERWIPERGKALQPARLSPLQLTNGRPRCARDRAVGGTGWRGGMGRIHRHRNRAHPHSNMCVTIPTSRPLPHPNPPAPHPPPRTAHRGRIRWQRGCREAAAAPCRCRSE